MSGSRGWRLLSAAAACVVVLVLLGASAASAQAPRPKPTIVTVNDFFFGPDSVTIQKGRAVKWVWSSTNTYPHDVHLKQGPKNLKERGSYSTHTTAVTEASFKKTFERPGTYRYICTVHPTLMKLTLVVKK
ncbi:MAG TPA: plastocyanin/azurin family copper-binding protein [Solirubrobacterales bacterium]|nr:plastocyanin/azurin family copper-binding protein [Solirubrobacterales bacterium]